MTWHTYLHRRNDSGDVFYVGKGRIDRAGSRRNRTAKHVSRAQSAVSQAASGRSKSCAGMVWRYA